MSLLGVPFSQAKISLRVQHNQAVTYIVASLPESYSTQHNGSLVEHETSARLFAQGITQPKTASTECVSKKDFKYENN
jgi:hypothetical protein